MIPEDTIWILELIRNRDARTEAEKDAVNAAIEALKAQLSQQSTTSDLISKFIDDLEEIFANIREKHVDESVCGLCEYDGAYIGQSGDWCNECPGFNRDDCFKLSDKTRKEWTEEIIKALPPAQPEPHEGHWIDKGWNGDWAWQIDGRGNCWRVIECSECGKSVSVESNYCPHCGAKMKGVSNERTD